MMSCQTASKVDGDEHCGDGVSVGRDPFDVTLLGEYARSLLLGTAGITAVLWAAQWSLDSGALGSTAFTMVIANLLIIGAAVGQWFAGFPRLILLAGLASWVTLEMVAGKDSVSWWQPALMFSPAVTVVSLIVLMYRDLMFAIGGRLKVTWRGKTIVVFVLAAMIYMIVIPGVDAVVGGQQGKPQSYRIEDLSLAETLRVRSSKLAVFAIFAYTGACVGSFLNVVAASAPRGESIAFRSSACPQCGTPIRRIDNLPIVSYLSLGGRCRDCSAEIPIRYFITEAVGLVIFASLFLYELVTGAANVPGFQLYHHAGILWIILYTKWPVVGIYFFHCLLFSCILMLALTERDRLNAPPWLVATLIVLCLATVVASPTMLTVSIADQTPFQVSETFPSWLDRAANSLGGGLFGWAFARFIVTIRRLRLKRSSSLTLAFVLLGMALGWQAILTIAVVWLIAVKLLASQHGRKVRPSWLTATALLFAIAMLHHPVWRWTASTLSF
ncbi:prepilin peptidase [Roseiconus lacunae]|uniref:A24 family peptidase n=1 Tax=Roseiconus lacunae TaxID=2605694 RepID=UPI0011F2E05A